MKVKLFDNGNQAILANKKSLNICKNLQKFQEPKKNIFISRQIFFGNIVTEKTITQKIRKITQKITQKTTETVQQIFYNKNGEIDFIFCPPTKEEKDLIYYKSNGKKDFIGRINTQTLKKLAEIFYKKDGKTIEMAYIYEYDTMGKLIREKVYQGNIKAEEIKHSLYQHPLKV